MRKADQLKLLKPAENLTATVSAEAVLFVDAPARLKSVVHSVGSSLENGTAKAPPADSQPGNRGKSRRCPDRQNDRVQTGGRVHRSFLLLVDMNKQGVAGLLAKEAPAQKPCMSPVFAQ